MNDTQRRGGVTNDPALSRMWAASGVSLTRFVKANRKRIDRVLVSVEPQRTLLDRAAAVPNPYNVTKGKSVTRYLTSEVSSHWIDTVDRPVPRRPVRSPLQWTRLYLRPTVGR